MTTRASGTVAAQVLVEPGGGLALHVLADVTIGVDRRADRLVAELRADDGGVFAEAQHPCGPRVAQAVERYGAQAEAGAQAVEAALDGVGVGALAVAA